MKFSLQGLIDVLTWKVSWLDANFFWVLLSFLISVFLVLFFMSVLEIGLSAPELSKEKKKASNKEALKILIFLIIVFAIMKISEFFIVMFE